MNLADYPLPKWAVSQARRSSGLIEDICHHGCGHPNRDWLTENPGRVLREAIDVHGCCGCCHGSHDAKSVS